MHNPYKTILLLIGDIVVLYFSLFAMLFVRYGSITEAVLFEEHITLFSILFAFWILVFYIHNLYDLTAAKNTLEFYSALGRAILVNAILAVTLFYFVPFFGIAPKTNLFITLAFFAVFFSAWRQIINRTLRQYFQQNVLVVGPYSSITRLTNTFLKNPQIGYRITLVFTEKKPRKETTLPFIVCGPDEFSRIAELAHKYQISTVVVSEEAYRNARVVSELEKLLGHDIEIVTLENMQERLARKVELERIDELWFFDHFASNRKVTYGTIKRFLDIVVSLVVLPFLTLVGLLVAALIRIEDGGPILYTQRRVGERGTHFTMYKFRTMRPDAEKSGVQWTVVNDPRITRIGKLLRKTRLDEIPQIINILKGDMSFVGPRAERPEFHALLKKEIPFYERRYLLKPGLTGWAQINQTYGSSVEDTKIKLAYDFYYLKNRSLVFDTGIILKTADLILRGLGR